MPKLHKWRIENKEFTRSYTCKECGIGPIYISFPGNKSQLREALKKAGYDVYCDMQKIRQVMED